MLLDLYKLINKSSVGRTPLEDFNTECLAGVLQQCPQVLQTFIHWVGLPEGNYKVSTQVKHYAENDDNSIIDLLLENSEVLCIIENKVNSKEGSGQLDKYIRILDQSKKQTFLRYCTKFVDAKKNVEHNFFQFRWYEVAKLLETKHFDNALVLDYLIFLKKHQMTRDTSISTDTVIAANKFLQTFEAMNFHVSNALPAFEKNFPRGKVLKEDSIASIRAHDRVSRYFEKILKDKTRNSQLLYGIYFEEVKLQTLLWVNINHPKMADILDRAKKDGAFRIWENEWGIGVHLDQKLYQFIEDKNSDQNIKDWFENSFCIFRKFIDDNLDLGWDQDVL